MERERSVRAVGMDDIRDRSGCGNPAFLNPDHSITNLSNIFHWSWVWQAMFPIQNLVIFQRRFLATLRMSLRPIVRLQ
jgi:hypothetical protein